MKDALGHPRENVHHGIDPVLLGRLCDAKHAQSVGQELPVEELVHHIQLKNYVDQAESLTSKVSVDEDVVSLKKRGQHECVDRPELDLTRLN